MIAKEGKFYLYRHIRLDTNKVFYVGIGTKPKTFKNQKEEYIRSFVKSSRSIFWKNIVNKTEYKIEIILESNDYEFIKNKEREFIKLYGRSDKGIGTLVNLTDGGEAVDYKGWNNKIVYKYDLNGNFIEEVTNISKHSISLGGSRSSIQICLKLVNPGNTCLGFIWRRSKVDKVPPAIIHTKRDEKRTTIYQYNLDGELVFKTLTIKDLIARGFCQGQVSSCCLNKILYYKNNIFSIKELSIEEITKKLKDIEEYRKELKSRKRVCRKLSLDKEL